MYTGLELLLSLIILIWLQYASIMQAVFLAFGRNVARETTAYNDDTQTWHLYK